MPFFARPLPTAACCLLTLLPVLGGCSPSKPADDDDTSTGNRGGVGGASSGGRAAGGAPTTGGSGGMATGAGGVGASGGTAGTGGPPPAGAGGTAPGGTGGGAGTGASAGTGGSVAGTAGSAGTPGQGGAGAVSGQGGDAGGLTMAGSGGDAGSGAGGAAGAGGGKATGFFMDDFESGTSGMQPPGWDNLIAYNANGQNPSGTTLALTDAAHVHGGAKAVHFHGDGNPAQLVKALDSGMTKLYIRVWVYMTRKLGQQTDMSANHETLIALRRVAGGVNDEARFGEIKGVVGVNEVPSDNISPTMDKWHQATGPLVPANTWVCLEVAFLADSMPNTLHAWTDGTLLSEVTSVGTDQWQNGAIAGDWLGKKFGGTPSQIVIGWQSFSSAANDVWMDDLILSTSPIGCN